MRPAPSSQELGVPDTPADRPRVSFLSRGWGCDVPALEGNSRMAWAEAATPPPSWARVTRGPTCSFPPALLWAGSRRGRPHRQPGSSAWRHMCVDVCSPCGRPVCACCRVCGVPASVPSPAPASSQDLAPHRASVFVSVRWVKGEWGWLQGSPRLRGFGDVPRWGPKSWPDHSPTDWLSP